MLYEVITGISIFANSAFVQLPVTRDYGAAKLFIQDIETNMVSNQGTNVKAALEVASTIVITSYSIHYTKLYDGLVFILHNTKPKPYI